MKKITVLLLAVLMLICLSGCSDRCERCGKEIVGEGVDHPLNEYITMHVCKNCYANIINPPVTTPSTSSRNGTIISGGSDGEPASSNTTTSDITESTLSSEVQSSLEQSVSSAVSSSQSVSSTVSSSKQPVSSINESSQNVTTGGGMVGGSN